MSNHTHTHMTITGDDLRLARIIYGFDSQERLGEEIGVALGTIQRYEAMQEIDAKILGIYTHELGFDLVDIIKTIKRWKTERIIFCSNRS